MAGWLTEGRRRCGRPGGEVLDGGSAPPARLRPDGAGGGRAARRDACPPAGAPTASEGSESPPSRLWPPFSPTGRERRCSESHGAGTASPMIRAALLRRQVVFKPAAGSDQCPCLGPAGGPTPETVTLDDDKVAEMTATRPVGAAELVRSEEQRRGAVRHHALRTIMSPSSSPSSSPSAALHRSPSSSCCSSCLSS